MDKTEKRMYSAGLEVRSSSVTAEEKIIEGHAAVFNQPATIGGQFVEVIDRGAFEGCDMRDVMLFVNHDASKIPLARTTSGTLDLTVDNVGLAIRAKLDVEHNPDARALYYSIARGDVGKMSFAFIVAEDKWENLNLDTPKRIIYKIEKIFEVSAVHSAAYDTTDLQARAKQILIDAKKGAKVMTNYDRELLLKYGFNPDEKDEDERIRNLICARNREADCVIEERKRMKQPPKYIPGMGFFNADGSRYESEQRFIPVHEGGESRINSQSVTNRIQAGQDLKERRAVISEFNVFGERRALTVAPADGSPASIVVPSSYGSNIQPNFPVVSSLVDAVAHLSLDGGESFSQPYVKDISAGDYRNEGEDYAEAETVFGYSQINRTKITAFCELTEELEKLPAAAYADLVFQNIRTSIRKVLTREILFGNGISDNQKRLVGIFSDKATAIDSDTDLSLSAITDTTLNEILYRFGGEEQVESPSCLILNKLDLLSFANVRTSTKQNFYDIEYNGNGVGGTINGVPFIIDSACNPLTGSDTKSGDYCMCYGNLSNYLLVEFSPLEIKRSDDFKFKKGIVCFRGSAICGGNVIRRNGFIRIKRK